MRLDLCDNNQVGWPTASIDALCTQVTNEASLGPPSEWIMMQVLYHDRYQDKT
jgi:hypothetical protein